MGQSRETGLPSTVTAQAPQTGGRQQGSGDTGWLTHRYATHHHAKQYAKLTYIRIIIMIVILADNCWMVYTVLSLTV